MAACGGAHYWARKLGGYEHTVKPTAPQFVKPYVTTDKNDVTDAEAVGRLNKRPVPKKTGLSSENAGAVAENWFLS